MSFISLLFRGKIRTGQKDIIQNIMITAQHIYLILLQNQVS